MKSTKWVEIQFVHHGMVGKFILKYCQMAKLALNQFTMIGENF